MNDSIAIQMDIFSLFLQGLDGYQLGAKSRIL